MQRPVPETGGAEAPGGGGPPPGFGLGGHHDATREGVVHVDGRLGARVDVLRQLADVVQRVVAELRLTLQELEQEDALGESTALVVEVGHVEPLVVEVEHGHDVAVSVGAQLVSLGEFAETEGVEVDATGVEGLHGVVESDRVAELLEELVLHDQRVAVVSLAQEHAPEPGDPADDEGAEADAKDDAAEFEGDFGVH